MRRCILEQGLQCGLVNTVNNKFESGFPKSILEVDFDTSYLGCFSKSVLKTSLSDFILLISYWIFSSFELREITGISMLMVKITTVYIPPVITIPQKVIE